MPAYTTVYLSNASNDDLVKDYAHDENPVIRELAGRLNCNSDVADLEAIVEELNDDCEAKDDEITELKATNMALEKDNDNMADDIDRLIDTLNTHTEAVVALTAAFLQSTEHAETPPVSASVETPPVSTKVVEAESAAPSPAAEASTTPNKATRDDVKNAVIALAERTGSRDKALAILKEHDATSLPTLDESKYVAVINACEAA